MFLPFQEVIVSRHNRVNIVSPRECDEVVVLRVTGLGPDFIRVVDEIDERLNRVNEKGRVLETDPPSEMRTSCEDLANFAHKFRAHHNLEPCTASQPGLDDPMRCTLLNCSGHEHVRINDDKHCVAERSAGCAATTHCSNFVHREGKCIVLVESVVRLRIGGHGMTC